MGPTGQRCTLENVIQPGERTSRQSLFPPPTSRLCSLQPSQNSPTAEKKKIFLRRRVNVNEAKKFPEKELFVASAAATRALTRSASMRTSRLEIAFELFKRGPQAFSNRMSDRKGEKMKKKKKKKARPRCKTKQACAL